MQLIVLCLCICALSVVGQDIDAMRNMPKYDSRYDYLDVDGLFNSKRLVRNYVDCLVNGQRCTPEGKALKRLLPEALRTKCVRCTERQKKIAVKIIRRLKNEYPDEWAKLSYKWDPTGDFTRYFEVFLANEQFNSIPGEGNEVASPPTPTITSRPTPVPVPVTSRPTPPRTTTTTSTPPRPLILNRFDDEVLMESPSSAVIPTQPPAPPTLRPTTMRQPVPPRPTPISWASAGSEPMPTRFTLRPNKSQMPLPYSTAITFIDQIGIKIIRTTELVTDILRNTVRAVVGR